MKEDPAPADARAPATVPGIGRAASRHALLPTDPASLRAIEALSRPQPWRFIAWTGLHLLLWAALFAGVLRAEGQYGWQLLLGLLMGSQLHALTVLQHDCGHQSAFASRAANLWWGRVLAVFILLPYTSFTELHRMHHAHLGDEARDPDEWFYRGGRRWLFLREALFMPRFIWRSLTATAPTVRRRVRNELMANLAALVGAAALLIALGRFDAALFAIVLPMLTLAVLVNPLSRGFEHYPMSLLAGDDPRRFDLRFNTVTVTSPLVGLAWVNINYHVEHHLFPRVPFFNLPALHRLLRDGPYLQRGFLLQGVAALRSMAQTATAPSPDSRTDNARTDNAKTQRAPAADARRAEARLAPQVGAHQGKLLS